MKPAVNKASNGEGKCNTDADCIFQCDFLFLCRVHFRAGCLVSQSKRGT